MTTETGNNPCPESALKTKGKIAAWAQLFGLLAIPAIVLIWPLGLLFGLLGILLALVSILRRRMGKEALDGLMGGLVSFVITAMLLPTQQRAMDQAKRIYCLNNISAIVRAVGTYAAEGLAVPSQPALLPFDKTWRCPFNRDLSVGYFYLPPAAGAPDTTIVICDYFTNHKGKGRNVGYLGANSGIYPKWRTEEEFQQELQRPENRAFAEALKQSPQEQQR